MLYNYFKSAMRNILKNKGFTFINLTGLSIGMAVCIVLLLWVQQEYSFDRFNGNYNSLYRMYVTWEEEGVESKRGLVPVPMAQAVKDECPEIIRATRVHIAGERLILSGSDRYQDDVLAYADPDFFEMFTFPAVIGDPVTALKDNKSVVITHSLANKYFGKNDPIGEMLNIERRDYQVAAVINDIPVNSHLDFDCMVSFDSRPVWLKNITDNWDVSAFYAYVQVSNGADLSLLSEKMLNIVKSNSTEDGSIVQASLQHVGRIHLHHDVEDYLQGHGNIKYVYLFTTLAIFVLLIACFNFINLTTGRSGQRAREIGMRKVVGAQKKHISAQFMGEAVLLTLLAFLLALTTVELLLPVLNQNTGMELHFYSNLVTLWGLLGIVILTGLVSGSYPAFILAGFQPILVLKGIGKSDNEKGQLRKILVIAQFAMSVLLIITAIVIFNQLSFIRNKNLGYDKDHLLYVRMRGDFNQNYSLIKNELNMNPFVSDVSGGTPPVHSLMPVLDGKIGEADLKGKKILNSPVDYNYISLMGMQIVKGRNLIEGNARECILNETAVRILNLQNPIGQNIEFTGYQGQLEKFTFSGQIVGVVQDFHHTSLHQKISPIVMYPDVEELYYLCTRVKPNGFEQVIKYLNNKWLELAPDYPFEYHFIDETLSSFYMGENRIGELFLLFTLLAIFISALGLLGLSMFMVERKTKEIGVRKVLGAGNSNIFLVLSKRFALWVLVGNAIAVPVAWYGMQKWLENFAYRIELTPFPFILGTLSAFFIAFLAISWQMIKAARTKSVVALRYE